MNCCEETGEERGGAAAVACLTSPEVAALAAKQLNRNTLRAVVAPACLAAVADGAWHTYSLHNIHIYKFLGKRSAFHTYKQGFSRAVRASRSEFRFYDRRVPPRHGVVQAH